MPAADRTELTESKVIGSGRFPEMQRFQTPLHYARVYAAIKKEGLSGSSSNTPYGLMWVWNSGVKARRP